MIVLVNGLPLFSRRLVEDLQSLDKKNRYYFLDTYNSRLQQLFFSCLVPFAGLVISMNGVTNNSGSLNWTLRWKKKLILQWMGTDIIIAIDRLNNRTINRKYIDYAHNFVDAPWMLEEVNGLGVSAKLVPFKYCETGIEPVDKFDRIQVISYVPQTSQAFYGMEMICQLAKQLPAVLFKIYGVETCDFEAPENVECIGLVEESEFKEALRSTPILVRFTEHDGFSATVIEALSLGLEVLWTFPLEHTHFVKNLEEAQKKMIDLIATIEKRDLTPNVDHITFARKELERSEIINNYINTINRLER